MPRESEIMNARARSVPDFTILDWIGTVVAGLFGLGLLAFPLVARHFAAMFRDLGSSNHLAGLTSLVVSTWFPMLLGLVVVTGITAGVRNTLPLAKRRALIVGAFIFGAVGFGVCLVGLYLPIFAIADAVRAE
jgi:hypothetical protein